MPQLSLEERISHLEGVVKRYLFLANKAPTAQYVTVEELNARNYATEEDVLKIWQSYPVVRQSVSLTDSGSVTLLDVSVDFRVQYVAVTVTNAPSQNCTFRLVIIPKNYSPYTFYVYVYYNSTSFYPATAESAVRLTPDTFMLLHLDGNYFGGVKILAQVVEGTGHSPNDVVVTLFGGPACY